MGVTDELVRAAAVTTQSYSPDRWRPIARPQWAAQSPWPEKFPNPNAAKRYRQNSIFEQHVEVAAAVRQPENQHVSVLDAVDDHVLANR